MTAKDGPKETLGQRLRRLRDARGVTQAQLAKDTGLPLPSIRNWETDYRQPRVGAIYKLALALDVRMEELAALTVGRPGRSLPRPSAGLRHLRTAWARATPEDRRLFLEIIRAGQPKK